MLWKDIVSDNTNLKYGIYNWNPKAKKMSVGQRKTWLDQVKNTIATLGKSIETCTTMDKEEWKALLAQL